MFLSFQNERQSRQELRERAQEPHSSSFHGFFPEGMTVVAQRLWGRSALNHANRSYRAATPRVMQRKPPRHRAACICCALLYSFRTEP